ncbi:Phenoloxidase 2 [Folsomia candida]|uniref:Phenoloxidase 2 n=1 Tax=Folsomia candida TaxID=158441 RepID=A0A226CZT5_FOLCA|nr:Phenoloxidase 2 [Folsomia candida]
MDSRTRQKQFMYLLERIGEPLYVSPRGQGKSQVVYSIPQDALEDYEANAMAYLRKTIPSGSDVSVITVNKTATPYDLTPVQVIPRTAVFSYFSPVHQKAADALIKILSSKCQPNLEDYFNACTLCRDAVNPHLWVHAFLSTAIRREDMKGFIIPHLWEITPDLFFEARFLREAHKQSALPVEDRAVVEVPLVFTGFDTNPEHKVAYWREDVGVNSFHWHWHLVNPFTAPRGSIDRQGELFYSAHHEMLGRYNTERISNGLNRVTPIYLQEGSIVEEAYFSKLTVQSGGRNWGVRQENTPIRDIVRIKDPLFPTPTYVTDVRLWSDRIKEAIDAGFALSLDGKKVSLRNDNAIDIVGGEEIGVIGSTNTACRDTIFWRWHTNVDLILQRQKAFMPPYTATDLLLNGVSVSGLEVHTPSLDINTLLTFWMQSDVDLSRGLDFLKTDINNLGPIWARLTHLQHRDFEYHIIVRNSNAKNVTGTVRIFAAPKFDEQGDPLPFDEQRTLFFQMDKFTTTLKHGENLVQRKSIESALTIPWSQTFRQLERSVSSPTGVEAFCGCGWPQNLLVPKGKHGGLSLDFFVMITDWEVDRVNDPRAVGLTESQKAGCVDAAILCGTMGRKVPDAKAMGFPFDRLPAPVANTNVAPVSVAEFIKPYPNMIAKEVKVYHRDVTVLREDGAPTGSRVIRI